MGDDSHPLKRLEDCFDDEASAAAAAASEDLGHKLRLLEAATVHKKVSLMKCHKQVVS